MTNNLDITNSSLLEDFSNAVGKCGTPPLPCVPKPIYRKRTIKVPCPTVANPFKSCDKVIDVPDGFKIDQACKDKNDAYRKCVSDNLKSGIKKVTKKLNELRGKIAERFRNAFRKAMRKRILNAVKNNIHGLATKMYAAISSPADLKSKKFKASFISKSKNIYPKILAEWRKLGGTDAEFNNAVKEGYNKKFLKNPFKSINGNNPNEFYNFCMGDKYSMANAEEETQEGVVDEQTGEEYVPDQEEEKKGFMGFIAKILAMFKKNNANETPYDDGSAEATDYNAETNADSGNQPSDSEANNDVMNDLNKTSNSDAPKTESDEKSALVDDSGKVISGDDKILGMPKGLFFGLGAVVILLGGALVYKAVKRG